MNHRVRVILLSCLALLSACTAPTLVRLETTHGPIDIQLDQAQAPLTTANFLRYVDAGHYDKGRFHRSVRLDNQARSDVTIEVIQAGINPAHRRDGFEPIPLERTRDTGLLHLDGAISMARGKPDSASSDWFICIGDQPSLDFGGSRNKDGQGFAVFGRVVTGMDVVRTIQASPSKGERLNPPIEIQSARRLR